MSKIPYILQDKRDEYDPILDELRGKIDTAGQMGYLVAKIVDFWLLKKADLDTTGSLRYSYMGEVFGLLESIKLDFYHCVNEPYENDVRSRAGTVWECLNRLPGRDGNPV